MSNLGSYQMMTTVAKKVGGPKVFITLTLGAGALLYRGSLVIKNSIRKKLEAKKLEEENAIVYTINKECITKEGLTFMKGDQFKVLERDNDATLIEIIDDENNPYFVSAGFLSETSDFKI